MPQDDKSAHTKKQKRQARHIEQSYEERGLSPKTAARRAWATVNKQDAGGLARTRRKQSKGTPRASAPRATGARR